MNRQNKILPWIVLDFRPKIHISAKRFSNKTDADNYAKILRTSNKDGVVVVSLCDDM